jgi:hypothetical protein
VGDLHNRLALCVHSALLSGAFYLFASRVNLAKKLGLLEFSKWQATQEKGLPMENLADQAGPELDRQR